MNQQVADTALMLVLPLGITFTAILQSAAAETRYQKLLGAVLSFFIVVLDCIFYFAKGSLISYNCDGGLLLAFASLFLLAIIYSVRSEDLATKSGNIFLAIFALSGFMGIAYWDRPTFMLTADNTAAELDARHQEYIEEFANKDIEALLPKKVSEKQKPSASKSQRNQDKQVAADAPVQSTESANGNGATKSKSLALDNLNKYMSSAEALIKRMQDIVAAINAFEQTPANITEPERENRSRQALAFENNANALSNKVLALRHSKELNDAHAELVAASESTRSAAHALYSYAQQDNPEEIQAQYKQVRIQIAQVATYLGRFRSSIEVLRSNYQQTQTEQ